MNELAGLDGAQIRIILADSHTVYRVGILQIFKSEIDLRVVAQADTLAGVHRAVERFFSQSRTLGASKSTIIILEGNMIAGAVIAISKLVRCAPQTKIIIQLDDMNESNTVELYRRGVSGIIPRSISPELLLKCVRKTAAGETWIDSQSVNRLIEAYRLHTAALDSPQIPPDLSCKEAAIIRCITQGKRNKEIAYQLGTTEQVIKNYLRKVYDKLGVADRVELALYSLRHDLHKRVSDGGVLRNASVTVRHIQAKPNGFARLKQTIQSPL